MSDLVRGRSGFVLTEREEVVVGPAHLHQLVPYWTRSRSLRYLGPTGELDFAETNDAIRANDLYQEWARGGSRWPARPRQPSRSVPPELKPLSEHPGFQAAHEDQRSCESKDDPDSRVGREV